MGSDPRARPACVPDACYGPYRPAEVRLEEEKDIGYLGMYQEEHPLSETHPSHRRRPCLGSGRRVANAVLPLESSTRLASSVPWRSPGYCRIVNEKCLWRWRQCL